MAPARTGVAFWRSFAIFEGFEADAIATLDTIAMARHWTASESIFQRGDDGDYLVVVTEGRIKLSLLTAAGRELTLRYAEAGDIMGELSLLDGAPRSADATAATDTTGLILMRGDFERLQARFPQTATSLIRYLSQRLRDTTDQLESIALFEIEARLARFLLLSIRQYFGDDAPSMPQLRLDLSQTELAGVLGASRPKVNRAIVALEDLGAITRSGHVLTCDPEQLALIAEPGAT
ncbi:Crp/Fnr family transcriptional regulator [Devosia sp. SL43]|uniref:Crp/Fnr family transcriptional regulator n=1 Tax=Devosia sp. SL43 TaxID=2806348 RepID=UPI001F4244C8|nr:Crp/Fnr family transcriptional regulator [Devosia sp. SL43]UJW87198.1 Crp/Fnr family transcriptional regulator [Devosia sp. SL43]